MTDGLCATSLCEIVTNCQTIFISSSPGGLTGPMKSIPIMYHGDLELGEVQARHK